ncbi:MAG: SprT-like domain-containing protein [Bryobacteraceae bacterium]
MQQLESALFFETPEEIYTRVFRQLKPRTKAPRFRVEFRAFANANSTIRLENEEIAVRITDLLRTAPAPIMEALAYILLCKLYRRPIPRIYSHRYKLYLNRRDTRHSLEQMRQTRGRKFLSGAQGQRFNLEEIFEELNLCHFHGLMARPELGWSRKPSTTTLGHYDPCHHAIILSKILDRPGVPRLAVEYVMFHEMLHLRYPVEHRGARRCVHTAEFRAAEKEFPRLKEAKELLKNL